MSAEDLFCSSPSPVVSLVTDNVQDIVCELKASVEVSEKYENDVQVRLAQQIQNTNDINVQLDDEKQRNARLLYALSRKDSISSSEQSSNCGKHRDQQGTYHDPRSTFGTISPVLMQYRFGSSF